MWEMKNLKLYLISLTVLALSLAPVAAQDVPASVEVTSSVEDVVVTARRTDAPIWEVTRGDSSLILVGNIGGIPRDLDWRPEALEEATRRADRILMPQYGSASLGDMMRLLWRIRTVTRLPAGTTTADYLSPEVQARLENLMAGERNDSWRSNSFVVLSMDLMTNRAGLINRRTHTAADVVKDAAKAIRKPTKAVGTVRGDEMVDSLITLPPASYLPCLERAIAAAEAGPEAGRQRIEDWRSRRVVQVMEQPLEQALGQCWPWGDPEIAPMLRQQWSQAATTALTQSGVTLGVAQLKVLAEEGGVLDQLEAAGYEIEGPVWKKGQALGDSSIN
jgi:uncharacterized protein YbaP (TraB family)